MAVRLPSGRVLLFDVLSHQAELLPAQGLQCHVCKMQTSFVIIRDSVLHREPWGSVSG